MDTKELTAILVVAMVGCVIVAGFVPVVGESVSATTTFENDGYYYMTDLTDQSLSYEFDGTKWTINGEQANIDITDLTTIVAADKEIIRANGYFRGTNNLNATALNITVTANGITGTATVNGSPQTINFNVTVYYCAVTVTTDTVLSKYNVPTYLNEDSQILADGQSAYKSDASAVFRIEGSIADGFTVTPALTTISITDVECNYTAVSGYLDLYKVESITFKSVWNAGTPDDTSDDVTLNQTYSSYVVPAKVTAEKTAHADDNTASIISMLPFILIMGVVLMFVGVVLVRRYV